MWAMKAMLRKVGLFSLVIATLALGGCSFSTTLVVINLSDSPVEVRYRFREYRGSFSLPSRPAIKTEAELNDDTVWRDLTAEQFVVDAQSQTVRLTLQPRTALRMTSISGLGVSKAPQDQSFPLTEIVMRGANGTMLLQGEQVRMSFAEETKQTYSIAYR